MASRSAILRLQKEYKALLQEPPQGIEAHPLHNNILQWHYVLRGPVGSDYEGGIYHGQINFPPEFPWKPPEIKMLTPSGRFAPNQALCLSMSNYHPETWNPLWSVSTILTGVLSFMLEESMAAGAVTAGKAERRKLAQQSLAWNCRNRIFCNLFPDYLEQHVQQQTQQQAAGHSDALPAQQEKSGIFRRWAVSLAMAGAFVCLAIPLFVHLNQSEDGQSASRASSSMR